MRGRFRLLVWIAIADFFTVFSVATFAVYTTQRIRMRRADDAIQVDSQVRTLVNTLAERLRVHGIPVNEPGPDMAIELPEISLFDSGEFRIKDRSNLQKIALALRDVQKTWRQNFVLIVRGHTDSRPPRLNPWYRNNLELSRLRAQEVEKNLAYAGIHPPEFQVVAEGVGPAEPIVVNCRSGTRIDCLSQQDYLLSEQLKRNRRIELRFGVFSGNAAHEIH